MPLRRRAHSRRARRGSQNESALALDRARKAGEGRGGSGSCGGRGSCGSCGGGGERSVCARALALALARSLALALALGDALALGLRL